MSCMYDLYVCSLFPRLSWNIEIIQRGFKGVFVAFPMTTLRALLFLKFSIEVKSMQISGTKAIRTQIQPSKPKRDITNITKSQNTKRTYGQPSKQLFSKRWPLSNRNRTSTHKVKRHRHSDTKNRQQRTTTKLSHWNGQ